jgi:hypothetical protein
MGLYDSLNNSLYISGKKIHVDGNTLYVNDVAAGGGWDHASGTLLWNRDDSLTGSMNQTGLNLFNRDLQLSSNVATLSGTVSTNTNRTTSLSGSMDTTGLNLFNRDKNLSDNVATLSGAKADIQYYQDFSIPAGAWTPAVTNGAAAAVTVYGGNNIDTMAFDASTEEAIFISMRLPENYLDGSVLRWSVDWDAVATASGTAVFGLSGGVFDDSLTLSTALGAERTITDTLLTVGDLHKTSNDAVGITLDGTPVAGDFVILKLVVKTSGTISVDVLGINLQIQYRTKTTQPLVWA